MKAVVIRKFGTPEGLHVIELPNLSPGAGEVLVETEAIRIGFEDVLIRRGTLSAHGFREGHILGSEIVGTVATVGNGVDSSWLGRRVWPFASQGGGYAEQVIVPADELIPLPDNLTAADAVAVLIFTES